MHLIWPPSVRLISGWIVRRLECQDEIARLVEWYRVKVLIIKYSLVIFFIFPFDSRWRVSAGTTGSGTVYFGFLIFSGYVGMVCTGQGSVVLSKYPRYISRKAETRWKAVNEAEQWQHAGVIRALCWRLCSSTAFMEARKR